MKTLPRQVLLCSALLFVSSKPALLTATDSCIPIVSAVFGEDGMFVTVRSTKDLSNVVLKFCDGSADYKFDGLTGYELTFSLSGKTLAGVWIKSGCNQSDDGPGYGEFIGTECVAPTPTPTPTLPPDCMGVPGGQAVVDDCGKCGGDNSTCKDCAGTVNGTLEVDVCGFCGGDGTSCLGCDLVPNSGKVLDACGVCGGDSSTCLDCSGVPDGGAQIDVCGKCDGNNSTCLDCAGVPNGTARVDACGVCGGTSQEPCENVSGCQGTLDKCGVCNGNNACLDCTGIPNGGTEIDCCGVCGGDGSTCLDKCKFYKLGKEKKRIIKEAKALAKSTRRYSLLNMRCGGNRKEGLARISLAEKLSKETAKLLSFIADDVKVCNTIFCKKTSFTRVLKAVKRNTIKLYTLARNAQTARSKGTCGRVIRSSALAGSSSFQNINSSIKRVPPLQCN